MRTHRILSLIAAATSIVASHAQAPQGFSYQAVARDSDGDAVMAQPIGVQFVLHQGNPLGAVVYAETHSATTNSNGLFALTVGGGSVGAGTFSSIDWSDGPYFLEVGLDVSSSGSYTNVGTQQLMSVPYALYAGKSNVPDGTEVGQILHWDGDEWVAEPGLYVQGKRFGVGGETSPDAPLGIKGEPGQDDQMISFTSHDESQKWNINLNPTGNDVDGFSIDDASSGTGSSRVFIAPATGNVGLGTTDPDAALTIRSNNPIKTHFQNGDVPTPSDFWDVIDSYGMSTGQGNPDSAHIHLTLQSMTGHLGLGTNDPPAPLSIKSRETLKTYFETGDVPTQEQFYGISTDSTGFDIGQGPPNAMTSRLFIADSTGHIGIGTQDPPAPLSIESRDILKTYFQTGDIPTQDDFAFSLTDSTGFGIDEGMPGSMQSRLFIQGSSGFIGIGTTLPSEKLHIESSTSSGITGLKLLNTATVNSQGWKVGHLQDADERDGAFSILESGPAGNERMVILAGGNVGINEPVPDTKFHVSRPVVDPSTDLDLLAGTGIVVFGPMTDNVVHDYRGLQARHGEYVGDVLNITATTLNLQRVGGDILIHGDDAIAPPGRGIITADARLGLGTTAPAEKIDIDGAIKIGNTTNDNDGTIRYTGIDFEGRKGGQWHSLTTHTNTDGLWVAGSPGEISYAPAGQDPRVGVGTSTPDSELHVSGANDGGNVSIMVENLESSTDGGWLMSAVDDNAVPERMKTFAIHEKVGAELTERITVLSSTGNVGINEALPDVKLHVSRPVAESSAAIDLMEGTGIMVVGPMTDNIVFDHQGIQARTGIDVGGSWELSAGTLHLQRRGGGLILHETAGTTSARAEITADGKLGLGVLAPLERIDIDGAIKIGTTDNAAPADGTIRYNGSDFEGRVTGDWVIFNGSAWEKVDNTESIYYNTGTAPRVGIGTNTPGATLHTRYQTQAAADEGAMAAVVENSGTTLSTAASATRVGLGINCTGAWSSNAQAKNVGLYVSNVSGQTEASSNLAAVLNGNVVVGDITGQQVGSGGTNVLAIQNGAAPAASAGTPMSGVQLYSADLGVGSPAVLHVMTGDGSVIKLYRETALTPADGTPAGPVYDPTTAALINNMRTRIDQLETKLQAIGLLQ